jgi:hypothetical protein
MCTIPLDLERKFEQRWAARFAQPVRPAAPEALSAKAMLSRAEPSRVCSLQSAVRQTSGPASSEKNTQTTDSEAVRQIGPRHGSSEYDAAKSERWPPG